jgi:hypothetical protein
MKSTAYSRGWWNAMGMVMGVSEDKRYIRAEYLYDMACRERGIQSELGEYANGVRDAVLLYDKTGYLPFGG